MTRTYVKGQRTREDDERAGVDVFGAPLDGPLGERDPMSGDGTLGLGGPAVPTLSPNGQPFDPALSQPAVAPPIPGGHLAMAARPEDRPGQLSLEVAA